MSDLVLPCALALNNGRETDTLAVSPASFVGAAGECLCLTVNDKNTVACVLLNEDSARKLFNHLGIWLHKH